MSRHFFCTMQRLQVMNTGIFPTRFHQIQWNSSRNSFEAPEVRDRHPSWSQGSPIKIAASTGKIRGYHTNKTKLPSQFVQRGCKSLVPVGHVLTSVKKLRWVQSQGACITQLLEPLQTPFAPSAAVTWVVPEARLSFAYCISGLARVLWVRACALTKTLRASWAWPWHWGGNPQNPDHVPRTSLLP